VYRDRPSFRKPTSRTAAGKRWGGFPAWHGVAIEMVDLPMKNGDFFRSFLYVYQRVKYLKVTKKPKASLEISLVITKMFPSNI
jgi:hypothetical protein